MPTASVPYTEVTDFPSKGLAYPEGTVVKYRPYSFGEMEMINNSILSPQERYRYIMEGIDAHGVDKLQLTVPDFLYIALMRKIATLEAAKFRVRYSCQNRRCGKTNETVAVYDANNLKLDYIAAPRVPVKAIGVAGNPQFRFMPLRMDQFIEMMDEGTDELGTPAMLAKSCMDLPYGSAYRIFSSPNLIGIDAVKLKRADRFLYHGVAPAESECRFCHQVSVVEIDSWEAVIVPFRGSDEPPEDGIEFGD